jgi:phage-related protein (TIGR01555 family)
MHMGVTLLKRLDDWVNTLTSINVRGRDKRTAALAAAEILTEAEAEEIYAADDIAAKACDLLPEDMVREGFTLNVPGWDEEKTRDFIEYCEAEMKWKTVFFQAMSWANIYGGSAIYLGVDDRSMKLSEPLNTRSPFRKFGYMHVLNRYELQWARIQDNPEKPGCGLPDQYQMMPQFQQGPAPITLTHASRMIRFEGLPLPRRLFITNGYWGNSLLSRLKTPLSNFGQSHDAIATLLQEFSQAVFKVKDMAKIMTSKDGKSLLQERLDLVDYARSIINAVMIDAEEEFKRETVQLSGVPEILDRMAQRLVTATQYPHTILLGEAPGGGIGETGKSELMDYYNLVKRRQETVLKPALRQFIQTVFRSLDGPTKGVEPPKWDIEFKNLWQEPESEILDRKEKQARMDDIYVKNQVLMPEEVARSRFGSGQYSHETKLDFERPLAEESPTREEVEAGLPPVEEETTEEPEEVSDGQSS